jgi:hypothetical protein
VDGVGVDLHFGDLGLGSVSLIGPTIFDAVLLVVLSLFPLRYLMALVSFGIWVGHRRKPCKALATTGDDDVFDIVLVLGGATKCPSFLVTRSRLRAQLAGFYDGIWFSHTLLTCVVLVAAFVSLDPYTR